MEIHKRMKKRGEDGFSLLEIVSAVGILMVLTSIVGIASYNSVMNRQTGSAVQIATQTAYNDALSTITDYEENTTVAKSIKKSNDEMASEGISFTSPNYTPTKESLCVIGKIAGDTTGKYTHKIGPASCVNGAVQGLPPAEDQTLPDYAVADDITRIIYKCDGTGSRNARLNISNLAAGTRATLFGSDQSIIPVAFSQASVEGYTLKYRDDKQFVMPDMKNYSETFQIKNGVTYELVVEGKFERIATVENWDTGLSLDMTKCMTEIVELGEDNGLKEISSYGATKFTKMSEVDLPPTVTSLRYMFDSAVNFNDSNVSSLNTDRVTDMSGMFYGASNFNRSLSEWNTAKVTDMSYMFQNAASYNQNMRINGSKWNTQNVTSMASMFKGATAFNGEFGSWNVTKLKNMASMFEEADSFNQGIFNWNTNNVTNMSRMFYGADVYDQALVKSDRYKWDTSSVTNMSSMFEGAKQFNNRQGSGFELDWDTSNVYDMSNMFKDAPYFNRPIGNWQVGGVLYFDGMFQNATAFNQPLDSWYVSYAEDMSFMFHNATSFNQNINTWNTMSVTTFESMFHNATKYNSPMSNWNTNSAISLRNMFNGAIAFNQRFQYVPTGNVNLQKWYTDNVEDAHGMFRNAKAFNNGYPKGAVNTGKNFDIAEAKDVSYMFAGASSFNQQISGKYSTTRNFESMFEGATDFNNDWGKGVSDERNWILMWWNLVPIDGSTRQVNTSKMFKDAVSFNAKLGTNDSPSGENLIHWNRVINASYMFENATSFNSHVGDITSMGNINNMEGMFKNAKSFNQGLTNMNTTNVTNMKSMFEGATVFNNGVATNSGGRPISWNNG